MVGDIAPAPARTLRAIAFATCAVVVLLALRARSDGPAPALLISALSVGLITLGARPLMNRERSLPVVLGCLVATQLVLHVTFLFVATGRLMHAGSTGLFCSPSTSGGAGSVSCGPTDRGGMTLLGLQILSAAVAALWLRGFDRTAWALARIVSRNLGGVLVNWMSRLSGAMVATVAAVDPVVALLRRASADLAQPHSVHVGDAHGKRGPPRICMRDAFRSAPILFLRVAAS